jgi:hypothetical protein
MPKHDCDETKYKLTSDITLEADICTRQYQNHTSCRSNRIASGCPLALKSTLIERGIPAPGHLHRRETVDEVAA